MYIITVGLEYASRSLERDAVAEKQNVLIIDSDPEKIGYAALIGDGAAEK